MRFKYFFIILLFLLASCNPPKYVFTSYSKLSLNPVSLNYQRLIRIDDSIMNNNLLNSTYDYIRTKKFDDLEHFLVKYDLQKDTSDYLKFSMGLYYFFTKEYEKCYDILMQIKNPVIKPYSDLVMIDCEYEIAIGKNRLNIKALIDKYQKLIDDFPKNKQILEMTNHRIKLIKYGL